MRLARWVRKATCTLLLLVTFAMAGAWLASLHVESTLAFAGFGYRCYGGPVRVYSQSGGPYLFFASAEWIGWGLESPVLVNAGRKDWCAYIPCWTLCGGASVAAIFSLGVERRFRNRTTTRPRSRPLRVLVLRFITWIGAGCLVLLLSVWAVSLAYLSEVTLQGVGSACTAAL